MVNESPPVRDQPRVRSRALVYIISLFAVIALVIGGTWLRARSHRQAVRKEIDNRLNAIRLAGQPVNLQDLAKVYPDPPRDRDAGRLLHPAFDALVVPNYSTNLPFFGRDWPKGNAPFNKLALDELTKAVQANQKAFDLVPWENLKLAWFGSGFQRGVPYFTQLPISEIRSLVRFLCLNAAFEAETQQSKEAVQSLARAIAIQQTMKDGTIVEGVTKLALENLICDSLNRVLNRTALNDSDMAFLSGALMRTNLGAAREMLMNERAYGISLAQWLQSLPPNTGATSPLDHLLDFVRGRVNFRDQDLLDYLDDCDRNLAIMDLPVSNAVPKAKALDASRQAASKHHRSEFVAFFLNGRVSTLSQLTSDRVGAVLIIDASNLAYTRVARTALAIERWRLAHNGRLPDSLADLAPGFLPSIPLDPFDEKPLRYKKSEHGYMVYSIGPDLVDDGGKKRTYPTKESDHYDIVFSISR